MENTRNGIEVVTEITPKFFSAWDFGRLCSQFKVD
jgi:hypothetical protein